MVTSGHLVGAGEADDEIDPIADVDERADARALVDLDRDRAEARIEQVGDVLGAAAGARREVSRQQERPCLISVRTVLPTTWPTSPNASAGRTTICWLRASTISAVIDGPERDVSPSHRPSAARSALPSAVRGCWLNSTITPPNATTASRTPTRRTRRLDRFKAIDSRVV